MSSFDTYGIDGEEEINVNASNSHFIDDKDEHSFTAASKGYSQSPFNPIHMDNGNGNENGYSGFAKQISSVFYVKDFGC
nr:hypothetical protein CFP56_21510 [Quercus suber]POE61548.1 hypothetical protein CFP56_21511 [Quercus suber]